MQDDLGRNEGSRGAQDSPDTGNTVQGVHLLHRSRWLGYEVPKAGVQKMDSRVIGEFTCDKIDKLVHVGTMMDINILTSDGWYKPADALLQAACLTEETVKKYLQGRNGYGWHISDLKIYDKPRDLNEFSRFGFLGMGRSNCVCGNRRCENYEPSYHYMIPPTCKIDGCSICRPPQSLSLIHI